MQIFHELKRRNVLRVGAAYIVSSWLLIQVADTIFPLFGFGATPARLVVVVLAIGFIPVLILSWAFELTPQGLMRESRVEAGHSGTPRTGKKLDRLIMVVLALSLGYLAFDKFVLDPRRDQALSESAERAGAEQAREEARLGMFNDKSVAVLPFANRSEQKDDEYFTDGMHDELLTRLSRIGALKVISRTSVMRYRDTLKSIPEIARELSVATVLEGGVQRSGNHVRINVQLINARTDEHLWAEIYDRELTAGNLFAIQSEISAAIADSLQATLSPEEEDLVFGAPTENLEAYNHFLLGRQLMATRKRMELEQANREFTLATDLDPGFALAWVGVADTLALIRDTGAIGGDEFLAAHKAAVDKALALDDRLGEAWVSLSVHYLETGESEKAEAALRKGIELNPNYAQAYHWLGIRSPWRTPEQRARRLQLLYKAAQLDPRSSVVQVNLASALEHVGKPDEGRQVLQRILQWDPGFALAYLELGDADAQSGQLASAVASYRKALELDPGNGTILAALAQVYVALGEYESVARLREQLNEAVAADHESALWLNYDIWVARSDWEAGLEALAEAPEERRKHDEALQFAIYSLYLYGGDYERAREWLLKFEPWVLERELWSRESAAPCEYGGVLMETGDEVLGRDLVRFFLDRFEAQLAAGHDGFGIQLPRARCHVLAGEVDRAMDLLEQRIAEGHLINTWHVWGKSPWFRQLENTPRYSAIVEQIETTVAGQKALLEEMDGVGAGPPSPGNL